MPLFTNSAFFSLLFKKPFTFYSYQWFFKKKNLKNAELVNWDIPI